MTVLQEKGGISALFPDYEIHGVITREELTSLFQSERIARQTDIRQGNVAIDPETGLLRLRMAPVIRRQVPQSAGVVFDVMDPRFPQLVEDAYPYEYFDGENGFVLSPGDLALGITYPYYTPNHVGIFRHFIYKQTSDMSLCAHKHVTAVTAQRVLPMKNGPSRIVLEFTNAGDEPLVLDPRDTFSLLALSSSNYSECTSQFTQAQTVNYGMEGDVVIPVSHFDAERKGGIFS